MFFKSCFLVIVNLRKKYLRFETKFIGALMQHGTLNQRNQSNRTAIENNIHNIQKKKTLRRG